MLRSLWLDDDDGGRLTGPGPQRAAAARVGTPSVEIVGAGVTGLSCALTLAEAGIAVRVHDARGVAGGASGRNAGFALRGTALAYDEARDALGPQAARELWALSEVALLRLAALAGDAFRPEGSLRLAVDAAERVRIRAEYEALAADGFAAEWRRRRVWWPLPRGAVPSERWRDPPAALDRAARQRGPGPRGRDRRRQPGRLARRPRCGATT